MGDLQLSYKPLHLEAQQRLQEEGCVVDINDATSAMNDTHDNASTLLDDDVPLGEFLDQQIARAKDIENVETDDIFEPDCRGNKHLRDHGDPFYGCGALGGEESRISSQYKHADRLPRFGPQRCVIP